MKPSLHCFLAFTIAAFVFAGCRSSEETTANNAPPPPSATEVMQRELISLRSVNDSLRSRVGFLEQNNRSATARVAELETQLTELKERTSPPPLSPKPVISNAREGYARALKLFRDANYQEAAQTFQAVLDAGTPAGLEDNCYYWLGECSYGARKYEEAVGYFQKVFTFAISEKKDDAQIMIANSYLAMGNKAKAKVEYEKLIKKFPASPFIKRAKSKLATL